MASWLERTGASTAEGIERKEAAQWDRRRFLKTAVAAAAGASVTPIFQATARGPQAANVVIIGAGTAGLVCAYRLQQRGIAARVIEASTRAGGRMFSLRNFSQIINSRNWAANTSIRDIKRCAGWWTNWG